MRWFALPLTYAATIALALLLVPSFGVFAATSIASLGLVLVVLGLEQRWPNRPDWRTADGVLLEDVLHSVFGFAPGNFGGALLAGLVFGPFQLGLWPSRWPMFAQTALGLVLFEFGSYWQHRLVHEVPWLWRFHQLHHTPRRLVLIKASRIHALDLGTAVFVSMAPLCLLGASDDVLAWVSLVTTINAVVQHANVPLPTASMFSLLFATPQTHRSHHALERTHSDRNYGMNLMVFDRLFGTFDPPPSDTPAQTGVEGDQGPTGFLAQTFWPLWPRAFTRR